MTSFVNNYRLIYQVIIPGSTTIERSLDFDGFNAKEARKHVKYLCTKNSSLWITEMGRGIKKGKIRALHLYRSFHKEIKLQ